MPEKQTKSPYDALLANFSQFSDALTVNEAIRSNKSALWAIFTLTLKFPDESAESLATESLVDGSDDGKVDLIFFDQESKNGIVIQTTFSGDQIKDGASTNKADDLNTATSWLLSSPIDEVPPRIRSKTEELRNYLNNGDIESLEFWYIHNAKEGDNVKKHLANVENTAKQAVKSNFASKQINVFAREVGIDTISRWYEESSTPILVGDDLSINVKQGYELSSSKWKAYVTYVPAGWLSEIGKRYGDGLFSANIRGYMGEGRKDKSINSGIKKTSVEEPEDFWIYNNGLTCIVNDFSASSNGDGQGIKLSISGISIVNGAQTTGALSELASIPGNAYVPIRFVKCQNDDVIDNIIEFNNTQNSIKSADFRSRDPIQKRLLAEFSSRDDVKYEGRRSITIKPSRGVMFLQRDEVAQTVAALHKHPFMAYHQKTKIWEDQDKYERVFNESISALHIIFAESLYRAILSRKDETIVADPATLTETKVKEAEFLKKRGSTIILTSAIANCLELVLDRPLPNSFKVSFNENIKFAGAVDLWKKLVDIMIIHYSKLDPTLQNGRIIEDPSKYIEDFRSSIESTSIAAAALAADPFRETFREFAANCRIAS